MNTCISNQSSSVIICCIKSSVASDCWTLSTCLSRNWSGTEVTTLSYPPSEALMSITACNYSTADGSFLHLWFLIRLLCVSSFPPFFHVFGSSSCGYVSCYLWSCSSITPIELQAALMTSELPYQWLFPCQDARAAEGADEFCAAARRQPHSVAVCWR